MKKQFLLIFAAAAILSCNSAEKKDGETTEKSSTENTTTNTTTPATNDAATAGDDAQARVEQLKKLPPISNETMKSFFPEEALGMKRSSFSVNNAMGYAMGTASYRKDDADYSVGIFDCAGEAGASFYSLSYLSRLNMQSEDDNGYQKTVSFMGTNAIETFSKSNNQHSLHFVGGDRFWVTIEGNEGLDKLKEFANALNLDKLKGAK
ncbi:MAG TPA: hypothetical protein VD993_05355 [Chitinophagaceae bacterium]|nr:hypothetical protein [Chitinophagaceae bacterium]